MKRVPTLDRRTFLRRSIHGALGGAGLYSALGSLQLSLAAAMHARAKAADYKALVCVFLYGGNDSFNTVVPWDAAHYGEYRNSRQQLIADGGLALPQAQIQAQALSPLAASGGLPGGRAQDRDGAFVECGLHPALTGLRSLFNSGSAAIVANVGPLLYPVTQATYDDGSVALPPQLFSHSDQSLYWQTSRPDNATANGWGGRIADLLQSSNTSLLPMSVTLASQNQFQRGLLVPQYAMDSYNPDNPVTRLSYLGYAPPDYEDDGGPESWLLANDQSGGVAAHQSLLLLDSQQHVLERAYARTHHRAIANYELIGQSLRNNPAPSTPFPDTELGRQLRVVAHLVKAAHADPGMRRQVFFVASGGWDFHSTQAEDQQANLAELSGALKAFHDATLEMGVANKVTSFTASDFGRTLGMNGDGTDHGWGGHHFVVGGAVRGQRFYGRMPSLLADNNPDDTGYGQIIPTLSVDQYAATLASWFGVDASGLTDIFPNLGRFPAHGGANLGFML